MSWYEDETVTVLHGDCIEVMRSLPDDSVDSIVTDPPYGLGFMGKAWDDLPPGLPWAQECLRVLKPGGHLLAFGGTRTWHRLAVAVEDAGLEIRDSICWLYGSGFPKSLDVSKAIDKAAGAQREVTGPSPHHSPGRTVEWGNGTTYGTQEPQGKWITSPATPAAQQWAGWGTALKPAFEPVVVARKPLAGTVAANVLAWGTGALNIDGTRVGTTKDVPKSAAPPTNGGPVYGKWSGALAERSGMDPNTGRWPANVVLDGSQADALDAQSGFSKSPPVGSVCKSGTSREGSFAGKSKPTQRPNGHGDSGGASRFFPTFRYQAKAPTSERPKVDGVAHPTVKPLELMRWLVRLVTPPGGTVLEPFAGSGTTIEAAMLEGFRVIGIEREADYLPLILARIDRVGLTPTPPEPEPTLLDIMEGDVA